MRSPEDLIQVQVKLSATISLDRERITEDPAWASIADNVDLNDPEQVEQALYLYLGQYITREKKQLFDSIFMPSTNGPADIIIDDMKELHNGGNKANGTGVSNGS